MLFEYETQRLLLKIIKPEYGSSVLEFYLRDKALFERYEPDRMPGFYTTDYQKKALYIEFNKAIEGTMFRFYVYEKTDPQTIIGTISFSIFCMRLVVVARQVTNSPAGFIITDMQRRH